MLSEYVVNVLDCFNTRIEVTKGMMYLMKSIIFFSIERSLPLTERITTRRSYLSFEVGFLSRYIVV